MQNEGKVMGWTREAQQDVPLFKGCHNIIFHVASDDVSFPRIHLIFLNLNLKPFHFT